MGASGAFDPARRYVRVTGERANGLVAFDFAVGEPEVFVEMLLPRAAFDDFCQTQAVEWLPPQADLPADIQAWHWRLADATRFD